jgi:uncharacterized protein
LGRIAERVSISCSLKVCRVPKDNMIFELAVSGRADSIVTGDQDLLALQSFREIPIIRPAKYVELW